MAVGGNVNTDFDVGKGRRLRLEGLFYSATSIRSILKMTGRVPSLQQAIIMRSSLVQPRMMEPP